MRAYQAGRYETHGGLGLFHRIMSAFSEGRSRVAVALRGSDPRCSDNRSDEHEEHKDQVEVHQSKPLHRCSPGAGVKRRIRVRNNRSGCGMR